MNAYSLAFRSGSGRNGKNTSGEKGDEGDGVLHFVGDDRLFGVDCWK